MAEMPEKTIDLVVTSPPYGVGIDYDSWDDDKEIAEYWKLTLMTLNLGPTFF